MKIWICGWKQDLVESQVILFQKKVGVDIYDTNESTET